jgi:hypothetical protein
MHTEGAAGLAHTHLAGVVEEPQAVSEKDVSIEHGAGPLAHGVRYLEHGVPVPLSTWAGLSRLLGGCSG